MRPLSLGPAGSRKPKYPGIWRKVGSILGICIQPGQGRGDMHLEAQNMPGAGRGPQT